MLFDKNDKGAEEVKKLLGFIQASVSFSNLQTYITIAERDVKRMISKAVFDIAQTHYDSSDYETLNEETPAVLINPYLDKLVHSIQLSVILHAYRRYVPSLDVSHSDMGRKMNVSETEKNPFEWMIDKDDKNILSLAYEADEILLEYLDEYLPPAVIPDPVVPEEGEETPAPTPEPYTYFGIAWKNSDAYKLANALFINTALEFNDIFYINSSRRLFLAIIPIIREVELNYIKPCLKVDKYTEIKTQILAKTLTDPNKEILTKANVPLALYTMSKVYERFSVEFLPEGIFQNSVVNIVNTKTAATQREKVSAIKPLEREAANELKNLQQYLAKLATVAAGTTYIAPDTLAEKSKTDKFLNL